MSHRSAVASIGARGGKPRTRAVTVASSAPRLCPSCNEPRGEDFPKCEVHGCDVCVTCTCTWFRANRDPACAQCECHPSRATITAVVMFTRSLGLQAGPLRIVGPEEAARWRGEILSSAVGVAPVSPRTSARLARDFRALRREAPKLGVKPCPSCGESCQHFKNDGCHSVECGECGIQFCYACGSTEGDCGCPDCGDECEHCADVPDGFDLND